MIPNCSKTEFVKAIEYLETTIEKTEVKINYSLRAKDVTFELLKNIDLNDRKQKIP